MTPEPEPTAVAAELYADLAPQLRRILRAHLQVSDWVLDDACQIAWAALLARPEAVDPSRALGWLATTARREALGILRRARTETGLDVLGPEADILSPEPGPEEAAEFWERLAQLRRLSRRQQRIVWMQSLGYEYDEIATRTGDSRRTVERQLFSARRRLRAAA